MYVGYMSCTLTQLSVHEHVKCRVWKNLGCTGVKLDVVLLVASNPTRGVYNVACFSVHTKHCHVST